ncbi:hypothetical protein LX32DRAFT_191047 [Colletotrichum zoysiae]|uniref:Uncharacterized protein n=1 Tax=Colletotrichum zoysiae TaxID=1216348 RepID=A0AAD9H4Z9_9PEZI|nr:hypothetical protein LX32DRAFT_191047 [Colletotrichum zoysiae]
MALLGSRKQIKSLASMGSGGSEACFNASADLLSRAERPAHWWVRANQYGIRVPAQATLYTAWGNRFEGPWLSHRPTRQAAIDPSREMHSRVDPRRDMEIHSKVPVEILETSIRGPRVLGGCGPDPAINQIFFCIRIADHHWRARLQRLGLWLVGGTC